MCHMFEQVSRVARHRSIQDPDPNPDTDVTAGKLLNVLKSTRCEISLSLNIKVYVPANV